MSSKDTNRTANILLLLSGKTGKSLGTNWLETPDHKETYSAVTLYEKTNGAIYVLFGTGGETVKGMLDHKIHLACLKETKTKHIKKYAALSLAI